MLVIEYITSERDTNGNCYHMVHITNRDTDKSVSVSISGVSNINVQLREHFGGWEEMRANVITFEKTVGKRVFNRLTKTLPDCYYPNTGEDVCRFIVEHTGHITNTPTPATH